MRTFNFTIACITIVSSLFFFSSCEEEVVEPKVPTLEITENADLGKIITNTEGRTLYVFAKDVEGNSTCEGGCLNSWPIYYQEELEFGAGINAADVGVITRADGSKQNTFKGWPLYYFSGDKDAGDTNGEAASGVWFVAKPDYDFMIAEKVIDGENQRYLVDYNGRTLYYFTNDEPSRSNCVDNCLAAWPPFSRTNFVSPSTVATDRFGLIDGNNGIQQTTFGERPLYYFNQDIQKGDVNGQGVGDSWFILTEDIIGN